MSDLSRRRFLKTAAATAVAAQLSNLARDSAAAAEAPATRDARATAPATPDAVELKWVDGGVPATHAGVTWGVPWPKGKFKPGQTFGLARNGGNELVATPVQSWATATWPDGSLKWSAHAIAAEA